MVGQYSTRTMESLVSDVTYQINCETTKKGRMIAGTKRRICWKFGFSNREALQKGKKGTDCRGEEHEVVFVWSWTSGKKFVLADGHEVHWSKQSLLAEHFDGSWQCSWESQMAGAKRKLEVRAYTKKSNKNTSVADSSFRNFDLIVDGVAFSEMPQMFELGVTKRGFDVSSQQQQQQQVQSPQRRKHMSDNEIIDGKSTHSYSSQQKPPQRRKHIYDDDMEAKSIHSYSSQQQHQHQHPFSQRSSRTSFSATDLLYSASHHSTSSHHHRSFRDVSQNSFSAHDLLDFHEQPQQQQQRQAPLASCNELYSQSMPDMRYSKSMPDMQYGFSTSPTSVVAGGESVPHFGHQHHSFPPQPNQASPTSVASSNPFDIYLSATKPQQLQQHHLMPATRFSNPNIAPYSQQHQQSTVY